MYLSKFVDLSHPENLHWLAVFGSSILLSLVSSLIPNYVETAVDMRSHNRVRLFNETIARLHIAYIIFLLALITSNDIDKNANTMIWLVTLIVILALVLMWAIFTSGRTIKRIQSTKDQSGNRHQCLVINGVCHRPVGWRLGLKVSLANGLMAFFFGILCLSVIVNPSIIQHGDSLHPRSLTQSQQKDYFEALRTAYKHIARQTKDQFEEKALGIKESKYKDDKLYASYWYSYNGSIHQLGTIHEPSAQNTYKINEESIIGCGFLHQNSSVRWDDTNKQAIVWPYSDAPGSKDSCKYAGLEIAKIRSIVCATYNGYGDKNPETTVGICVFTTGDRNIFGNNNYHEFLKAKAEEFYNAILPLIKNKALSPQ